MHTILSTVLFAEALSISTSCYLLTGLAANSKTKDMNAQKIFTEPEESATSELCRWFLIRRTRRKLSGWLWRLIFRGYALWLTSLPDCEKKKSPKSIWQTAVKNANKVLFPIAPLSDSSNPNKLPLSCFFCRCPFFARVTLFFVVSSGKCYVSCSSVF